MAGSGKQIPSKTECINPNTGNSIFIDTPIYQLFKKAIYHTLKVSPGITYTEMVSGIRKCFKQDKVKFTGSIEWYGVVVKQDMEVKKIITVFVEKGKKLHRLSN